MIQKLYLIERLRSCKISTLNDLAILTGSPIISTNKSCRIEGLTAGYYFYLNHYHKFLSTQKQRTTLSIDVGIKNFSYCKIIKINIIININNIQFPHNNY